MFLSSETDSVRLRSCLLAHDRRLRRILQIPPAHSFQGLIQSLQRLNLLRPLSIHHLHQA